jgi:sugar lactone lactonase YvrE
MIRLSEAIRPLAGVAALLIAIAPACRADFFVGTGGTEDTSQVLRYDNAGNFLEVFVSPGNNLVSPRGLAFGPDGNFYVASYGTNSVLRYDGITGTFIDTFISPPDGPLSPESIIQPERLIFRDDGFLYVSMFGFGGQDGTFGNSVLRYDATTGAFDSAFVPPLEGGLIFPEDMSFGPDGLLYVSATNHDQLLRFDGSTGAFIDALAYTFGPNSPRGLTFDGNGNLYATDTVANDPGGPVYVGSVARFAPDGSFSGLFVQLGDGGLAFPRGIAFGPNGNLYVADAFAGRILQYDGSTGAFLSVFVDGLINPTFFLVQ